MRLYLDNCALQRPLDRKTELRVRLESEAVLELLALCDSGEAELLSSEILLFEIGRNPNPLRQQYALQTLASAVSIIPIDDRIEARARQFVAVGIKPLDALHLAVAESSRADYFCTCDERLLRRAKHIDGLGVRVVSPLELIGEIG
jgi:predicted nucleic acid-binding protein